MSDITRRSAVLRLLTAIGAAKVASLTEYVPPPTPMTEAELLAPYGVSSRYGETILSGDAPVEIGDHIMLNIGGIEYRCAVVQSELSFVDGEVLRRIRTVRSAEGDTWMMGALT